MSSLSTACFVHKKASRSKIRSSRSTPKKAAEQENGVSNKRADRLERFATLWEEVLRAIEFALSKVYSEILEDCVRYVEKASDRLVKKGYCDGEIPTAILITGVNMPDHDVAFDALREMIRSSVSPHVVSLSSANDADTVKSAVGKLVATLVAGDLNEDEDTAKRKKCTMRDLVSWYSDAESNAFQSFSTSPRRASRLAKRDRNESSPSPSKRRRVSKARRPIIVVFEDFERMPPSVARDFVLICSEYSAELPFVFVFGVSTSAAAVHKAVSQSAMSKLATETFRSRRSGDFLNIVVDEVLLNTRFPFKTSDRSFKLFEDVFLFNDLSVKTFVNGLKRCLMEHFYSDPLSDLCCRPRDLERQFGRLDGEALDELRKLRSFRAHVDRLPLREQKALLLDDGYLKEVARSKLEDLHEYHQRFFPALRFLHSLCKDLPKNLLGKQLRELYGLCLEKDVGTSKEFSECTKMLRMMARDELLKAVKGAADSSTASSSPRSSPPKSDIEAAVEKLEELKAKSEEKTAVRQDPKEAPEARRSPTAFESLREELIAAVESYVKKHLRNHRSLVFHEVAYVDAFKAVKSELSGNHRGSLRTALEDPGRYLKCACCSSSERREARPDLCVAYELHAECGRSINLSDWLRSFDAVIRPSDSDSDDANASFEVDPEITARFFHSVAELQFLGFVKPAAQGKRDHVTRLTW